MINCNANFVAGSGSPNTQFSSKRPAFSYWHEVADDRKDDKYICTSIKTNKYLKKCLFFLVSLEGLLCRNTYKEYFRFKVGYTCYLLLVRGRGNVVRGKLRVKVPLSIVNVLENLYATWNLNYKTY